jgi:signal transduction histidine kinase
MSVLPRSLKGQLIATTLVAVILSQILSLIVLLTDWRSAIYHEWLRNILVRTRSIVELVQATPPELREHVLKAGETRSVRYSIDAQPTVEDPADADDEMAAYFDKMLGDKVDIFAFKVYHGFDRTDRLRRYVREWIRDFEEFVTGDEQRGSRAPRLIYTRLSVKLEEGRWLNVMFAPRPYIPPAWPMLLHMIITAILLAFAIVFVINRMTKPLKELASAASAFGRGQFSRTLDEDGPSEVVDTIRAFNDMQERLARFIHDRTKMLAAIGHDLRTPITSLKLRAEFIEDEEARAKIFQTLDDMHEMAEATLSFAREEGVHEETRLVDIAALVTSVCEDLADAGKPVSVGEFEPLTLRCRPTAMKRALRNVVENAMIYGGKAEVTLTRNGGDVHIDVDDQGPGIAAADMERVFKPFVRLESSRSRDTGGTGLGLAIARSILRSHGGDIKLQNRPEGGLRASLCLSRPSESSADGAHPHAAIMVREAISTTRRYFSNLKLL